MHIAMIGTRGVPARYGGFETCLEEVGQRLVARGHDVTVFCRPPEGADKSTDYLGMRRVELPVVRRRSLETLAHTFLSVVHPALRGVDVALVFNAANAPLLPVVRFRRLPVATHVDGLEWKRAKWGPLGQRYYRIAESLSVRWSDALIADAEGIQTYYRREFGATSELIAYGAPILRDVGHDRLAELDLAPQGYHLVVARFEPENHVLEIVDGYVRSTAQRPLVVVGSAPYADAYTKKILQAADNRVRLVGGIWDQRQLDQLYANAATYLHGHSVGGTNPSLLRAAGAGAFTIAYDVSFNREVLGATADFFGKPDDLGRALEAAERDPEDTLKRGGQLQAAMARYDWDDVALRYEQLCHRLQARDVSLRRPSGRRRQQQAAAGS